MESDPALPALGVKRFAHPIRFPFTAYCDVHDLLAVVLDDWTIDVFRIANAQVAFTVKRKDDECTVTALHWKPDGTYLAVAWSDGTYVLCSGENGRLISQANIHAADQDDDWRLDLRPDFGPDDDEPSSTNVNCFGWTIQDGRPSKKDTSNISVTTDDWYDGLDVSNHANTEERHQDSTKKTVNLSLTDLARSITTLDVTKVFPRLSAIPAHQMPFAKAGPGGSKFASQTATDSIFQPSKDIESYLVHSLFVCQDDGNVQVLLDETVKIGSCHVKGRPLYCLSHPHSSVHSIISQSTDSDVAMHSIDLPLSTLSGALLHVIALNTKRIQNLLDYIAHTVRCIEHDFTTGQQLPGRLLKNLDETLSEKEEGTAVYNLYHLAMTGDFSPTMLEWLVDIVKETNLKRWDQAVGTMYTNIQNHIFMNLLPAIDRLSIAITTLRGHATAHEGSSKFDVSPQLFTSMLDAVDSMRLVAQKMQLVVMTEYKQFRTFSKWLRIYIEIGIAEPFSRSAIETEERELPSLDYSLLLAYIKDTMTKSTLGFYIQLRPGMSGAVIQDAFFRTPIISDMSYERTLSALKLLNENKPLEMRDVSDPSSLLNLPAITATLRGRTRATLQRITIWQSRMLPSPTSVTLPIASNTIFDAASLPDHNLLLVSSPNSPEVQLSTVAVSPSSQDPVFTTISLGMLDDGSKVLDAKFHSTAPPVILVLVQQSERRVILRHHAELGTTEVQHAVSAASFKPETLLVGGRRAKRVCVVFGSGAREWRALALDGTISSSFQPQGLTTEEEWEDVDAMTDV